MKPIIAILVAAGLYIVGWYNYLLFHSLAEMFSIVVACGVFMLAWNSRRFLDNNYLLFIGIAYLFVGVLDLFHTLVYQGIGITGGNDPNPATQLWIAARYLEAVSLLCAPFFVRRTLKVPVLLAVYSAAVAFLLFSVFAWHIFPDCFLPLSGLTPFKKISEYVISLILVASIVLLWRNREHFDGSVFTFVVFSIAATIISELSFTFYVTTHGLSNFVGHMFKILSFYLIYKAVIETGLTQPYDVLFRNLRKSEESVRQQREWLRVTLASIGDALIAVDTDGVITFVNNVAAQLLGTRRKNLIGQPVASVFRTINEQTKKPGEDIVRQVLREGAILTLEDNTALVTKDGREIPIEDSAAPIRGTDGSMSGVVIIFHDVTEKRRLMKAVEERAEELEKRVEARTEQLKRQADLLNLTHDAIIVCDAVSRRINFWNQGAEGLYGWSSSEAVGRISHDLLQTRFPADLTVIDQAIFSRGRWEGELIHTRRDGSPVSVASRWALERDQNGEPVSILQINNDITARKNTEQQLRQVQKQEALGVLAGGVAHDFNNILSAIIGFAELAKEKISAESPVYRHLGRIYLAGLRGRELIKQILAFSRKAPQEKKPVQLGAIVRETTKLLRASLPATIEIALNIDSHSAPVYADLTQIQQIVMNLCTNAGYAMRNTGGRLTIGLTEQMVTSPLDAPHPALEPGPYVRLTVEDSGEGMPPSIVEKIFDPFFTTKPKGQGTGLGLAVVQGIVASHQGAITVSSQPDKGTCFHVYFPRYSGQEAFASGDGERAAYGGREHVLFIDDEEAIVEMGREMLEQLGYAVTAKTNSKEALAMMRTEPGRYDLIITDQTMPGITGIELAKEAMLVRPDLPIILCTGFSHLVDAASAHAAGVRAFVMKPLTKAELAKTIRDVLDAPRTE